MLTVVFSTRNRCRRLPYVLERYCRLDPVPGGWRLLVVANACSDDTPAVLAGFADRLPLTVLEEPVPGKNRALNRALAAVEGDLVVFTDDDVLVEAPWLAALRRAADAEPAATLFGGTVRPAWPFEPPAWITRFDVDIGMVYALTEHPDGPCDPGAVWGPNMAIRATVFGQGYRFNADIGPDGTLVYAMGSEVDLNRRLAAAGHRAVFVHDAIVYHVIRPEQLEESWVIQRAYRHGLGMPLYAAELPYSGGPRLGGVPLRMYLRFALLSALEPLVRRLPPSRRRFRILYFRRWFHGVIRTLRAQHRRRAPVYLEPPLNPTRPLGL